jgi:hypothetical protein
MSWLTRYIIWLWLIMRFHVPDSLVVVTGTGVAPLWWTAKNACGAQGSPLGLGYVYIFRYVDYVFGLCWGWCVEVKSVPRLSPSGVGLRASGRSPRKEGNNIMTDKIYYIVVAHNAWNRIILVFWPFGRGYEPRLDTLLLFRSSKNINLTYS